MPKAYLPAQIRLHWIIAVLVLCQFLTDDAMGAAWRALRRTGETGLTPLALAHVAGGVGLLALMLWRVALRVRHGVPPLPATEPRPLRLAAGLTHAGLYGLLLVLPVTGLTAWFGGVRAAGELHETLTTILLVLIGLHVAGAAYQRLVLNSDVLARMLPFG